MKISGSDFKTISAMSRGGFSFDEGRTISETTQKLAQEGKRVINIIHGTPYKMLGYTCKQLTFLWEADDEDPTYIAHIKDQERQKLKDSKLAKINSCKADISSLKTRIQNAETPKKAKNKKHYEYCLLLCLLCTLAGIFFLDSGTSGGLFVTIVGGLGTISSILMLNSLSKNNENDRNELSSLKKQLSEKEKDLIKLKEEYNKI